MNNTAIESIKEKLLLKNSIYLTEDTYKALEKDLEDFRVEKMNKLINLLVENYITDYFETIYDGLSEIKKILEENAPEITDIDELAKEIAFSKTPLVNQRGRKEKVLNIRLQKKVVNIVIETLYDSPVSLEISGFFRNMILSYLALPIYRREQIIYKKEITKIKQIINNKEQLSYFNKVGKKTHVINPFAMDYSSHEMFNYLIGQFDDRKPLITTIRIANMEDIIPVHNKSSFSDDFDEKFSLMKENGVQFGMDEGKIRKVYLNEKQYKTFINRYFEKPKSLNDEMENGLHVLSFNCSHFQLKSFFTPFDEEGNVIKIEK